MLEEKIKALETDLYLMAKLVTESLVDGVRALEDRDINRAIRAIEQDNEIDKLYLKIDRDWFKLMATTQPVASDLRMATTILQASLHLERLGDLAVFLGKTTKEIFELPVPESIHQTIIEMGDRVIDMTSSAIESLKNRDENLAKSTAKLDKDINKLYNKMLEVMPTIVGNDDLYAGLFRLVSCLRTIERGGDHAVDICELTHFLVTGEFEEF